MRNRYVAPVTALLLLLLSPLGAQEVPDKPVVETPGHVRLRPFAVRLDLSPAAAEAVAATEATVLLQFSYGGQPLEAKNARNQKYWSDGYGWTFRTQRPFAELLEFTDLELPPDFYRSVQNGLVHLNLNVHITGEPPLKEIIVVDPVEGELSEVVGREFTLQASLFHEWFARVNGR